MWRHALCNAFVRALHSCRRLTRFLALLSVLGCGQAGNQAVPPTASKAPVPASPLEVTKRDHGKSTAAAPSEPVVPVDESDEWVPITGSEKVIVGELSHLTDGAAVRVAPVATGTDAAETAAGTRSAER